MKRFLSILLLASFCLSGAGAHADPTEDIQGATQKEREIRWLWKYMGEFVRSCQRAGAGCADADLQPVIARLAGSFPLTPQTTESPWGRRLVFVPETARPELFHSSTGQQHRLAATGLQPGDAIYINTDRMQIGNAQWVGILAHEASHNLGIKDDEARLPDLIGAAVAAHVERNWIESRLSEFGHPDTGLLIFNEPLHDRPSRAMFSVTDPIGLASTVDNDLTANSLKPVCPEGQAFRGQWASENLWRTVNLRPDKGSARIRGSALINNICVDPQGHEHAYVTNLIAIIDLKFKTPFDAFSAWWQLPSYIDPSTLGLGFGDSASDLVDLNRSFAILSVTNDRANYLPGDIWRTRIIVRSTDGFVPQECGVFFDGSKWMFNRSANRKMFDVFHSCLLTPLGGDQWQVDASFTFPENGQPDLFSLSMIYFSTGSQDRYAVPLRPSYVRFENPAARPPLQFKEWRATGLEAAPTLMGSPVLNSYRVEYDKPFWLEVDFTGGQKILRKFFDFEFIVNSGIGAVMMPWNVSADELKGLIVAQETVSIPGGLRLRFQIKLPREFDGLTNLGFHLRRVSVETDDFGWTELEIEKFTDSWFLTRELF